MRTKMILLALGALVGQALLSGCGTANAADPMTLARREGIELTVYAQDFAVVKEARPFDLAKGRNKLRLIDVSKQLDQNSVMFGWGEKDGAEVVSSTYDLGVQEGQNLLERFLGHEVELVTHGQDGREATRKKGILEVADPGYMVLKVDGKYLINPPGSIVAPGDGSIVTIPQLTAEVDSPNGQQGTLDMTYLTRGMSWNADYVATLSAQSEAMDFECWATVTNLTGTDFPDAKITLVAGSPNRAVMAGRGVALYGGNYRYSRSKAAGDSEADMSGFKAEMQPQDAGELKAYPVKAVATIAQDQMNRVKMLHGPQVEVKRDYSILLPNLGVYDYYQYEWGTRHQPKRKSAALAISFTNTEKDGLGMPLPRGALRVYEPDKGGSLRYIGAASIGDTPKDAKAALTLSEVFDVYAEPRVVSSKKIAKRRYQKQVEIVLHNEKPQDVELRLVQNVHGKWKMVGESHKSGKLNSAQNQWKVTVPAGGETTLKYTVEFSG